MLDISRGAPAEQPRGGTANAQERRETMGFLWDSQSITDIANNAMP